MSKNPVCNSLNKYLESEQRKYGRDFCKDSCNEKSEKIKGSSKYNGPEKGDKYGTIGDRRSRR